MNWARNYKSLTEPSTNAITGETVVPIGRKNFVTGRFEWSERDELFEYDHDLAQEVVEKTGKHAFNVSAITIGYTRERESKGRGHGPAIPKPIQQGHGGL